ncbi:MAG: SdrD B-like domain-containing protein [Candidatus Eisenbacteria bacterium]
MRRRSIMRALLVAWMTLAAVAPAGAQVVRNFTPRYSTNDNGDITMVGNTVMTCPNGGQCTQGRNGTGNNLNDNDWNMVYVDVDGDASTFSSSSATLSLPAGATVLWAGLYWQGDSNNGARNTVRFRTPATAYQTLTASRLDVSGTVYQGFIDVTALVQSAGSGTYWAANVYSTNNTANVFAGWGLVIVYRLASAPSRNLVVFDGFALVQTGNTVSFGVSGFITPPAGPVNTRLGVITGEGDLGFTGDSFTLNSTALSDAQNPVNNFFNSSISQLGVTFAAKNPNYLNQYGWDVDLVSANGVLPNSATTANITLSSTNDTFYPGMVSFATDLYSPVLSGSGFQKTVTDLNGGAVRPGDVLEYTLTFRNTGNDGATNVVARDTLPVNTTYVPGSLVVVSGANAGAKSDGSGDDQAEYDGVNRRVIFRIGTGATAASGGTLAPAVASSVRFRVTVNSPTRSGTVVSNLANVAFNAAQLGTALTAESDGDTVAAGIQPTAVTVSAARIQGTVFEDPNYGGGAGRTLAGATGAGRAGVRVELYSSAGAYLEADTTDATGKYTVDGYSAGSYQVRVVHATVTSSRPGATAALRGVQTFRTDATSGFALPVTDRVGGENPALVDAAANTTNATLASLTGAGATAQSVSPVTLGNSDITSVDFGYNFDTITNTNDSGAGSLRQFIVDANTLGNTGLAQAGLTAGVETSIFMVSDGLAHAGLRAGLSNLLTGGVAVITTASVLPALTDAFTRLDGGTQTSDVGNTNATTLGTGGTVGVDGLALPTLAGPEVEIRSGGAIGIGLDLQATDLNVTRVAIRGFGTAAGSDASADIRVGAVAARAAIASCVIGTAAGSFTDPGAGRSGGDHVRVLGADDGSLQSCLIGFGAGSGIALTAASDRWSVTGCELRGNSIGNPTRDGVSIEASANATLRGDLMTSNEGCGVDARTGTGTNTIQDCTVTRNGVGAAAGAETPGIRLGGSGNLVDHDVITVNYGAGVLAVSTAAANTITRNSVADNGTITNNGGAAATGEIGIDLLAAGQDETHGTAPYVTLNDIGDVDAGANGLANYPVISTAVLSNGTFTFSGWARPGSSIELYVAAADPSGFGEGQTWVGTFVEGSASDLDALTGAYAGLINGLNQGSDATNRFRFSVAAPSGVAPGIRLTATATIGGNTSEFSGLVTVTTGVTVSGTVYLDANHDAGRDVGENGIGVASWAKLVAVASPGSAQDVVAVNAATGAYSFVAVNAAQYRIVLDDNNSVADVTPTNPAGLVGTEAPGGFRLATVGATDLANQNFGLWAGSRVDGTVFRDDGAGGGLANDGTRQAGEGGTSVVRVRAASATCAGGACDSTLTDGAGHYTLWLPSATGGHSVTLSEVNPAGWLSTGGNAGSTGGAYNRAADAIAYTAVNGSSPSGADFGDVPPNQLAAAGVKTGAPGAAVGYAHTFVAGSAGSVSFSAVETPTPVLPGWGVVLYRDANCNGVVDAGETAIGAPLAVSSGQTVCLVLEHRIPAGARAGDAELVTLGASMSYVNAAPALVSVVSLDDRTTVIDAGGLELVKSVNLASAKPGDLLTYTITYRNLGSQPLSAILIRDATPAYTVFVGAACGALGGGLGGCGITAQPAVGTTGNVTWSLSGSLLPGASGTVAFQVRVQ